jgi:hypothetical protein
MQVETFGAVDPMRFLVVDYPAFPSHQHVDAPHAVANARFGDLANPRSVGAIITRMRSLEIGRSCNHLF